MKIDQKLDHQKLDHQKLDHQKLDQLIANLILGFPKAVLLFFILLAVGAGMLLPQLVQDPTPYLLPVTHESRVNLGKLRQEYTGTNDGIIVLLEAKESIFNYDTLLRIKNLTRAFEQVHLIDQTDRDILAQLSKTVSPKIAQKIMLLAKGEITSETWMQIDEINEYLEMLEKPVPLLIDTLNTWTRKLSPILEVTSLANTDNILGRDGKLIVSPLFDEVPKTVNALAQLKQEVTSNVLFDSVLVADGGKSTSIILELAGQDDQTQEQYIIYSLVKQIVEEQVPGSEIHYIAGLPVVTGAMGNVMEQDTQKLFPIVILIVIFCLFITFRTLKGIFIPLAVVILSLVVTLGLKVLFGVPLNIITTTLPVFILSIGVADGIHIFSEYRDQLQKGYDKNQAIHRTLDHLAIPVIMTSITTAVAFYAISLTQIVQLNHFGIFVSIGALVAMVYSLFFIPALLVLLPEKKTKKQLSSKVETAYARTLIKGTRIFIRHPVRTIFFAGIVFLISLVGASKVVVDNNNAAYFLKDSDIFISSQKLNQDTAGSALVNLLILAESTMPEPFKRAENLQYVDKLVSFLEDQVNVGKILGLTELIKRINFVLNDEDELHNRVPPPVTINPETGKKVSEHLISQLLLLYENGGGDTLSDFTDTEYTRLNIPVILQTNSSRDIYQLNKEVDAFAAEHFPDHIRVKFTGSASVSVAATDEIVNGQMNSLMVSLVLVLVMLVLTFRKISYAGIALVPLIMTISINFGIMGFFNIPLDIGTAIISSIVIGIGVDYAIHYLSRLKKNLNLGMDFTAALEDTVSHSGKAIVSNAATVGLGFIALLFSVLTPLIIMGWMISVTMLVSAFSTLVLIPVLLIFVEKRALRVDSKITLHNRFRRPLKTLGIPKTKCKLIIEATLSEYGREDRHSPKKLTLQPQKAKY